MDAPPRVLPPIGRWAELDRLRAFRPSVLEDDDRTLRMWYSGRDGSTGRILEAVQQPGQRWRHRWDALGTFMQRGEPDAIGATRPCLVVTGERWWLFNAGYDGADNDRHAVILAAVSQDGAWWDRVGPVLSLTGDELSVSEPSVLVRQRHFAMFYASDDGRHTRIDMATSTTA